MDLTYLFTTITLLATIHESTECGEAFKNSFKESGQVNCQSISRLANCLGSKYIRMGSPFGLDLSKTIVSGLSIAAEDLCGLQCNLNKTTRARRKQKNSLLDLGADFKICAFDFFLQVDGRSGKACDRMPELIVCFLRVSGSKLSRNAIELGRYIMFEIMDEVFGVRCQLPGFSSLRSKCRTTKDASS